MGSRREEREVAPGAHPIKPLSDRSSWFLSHWRGETSLGISYWLNGILRGSGLPTLVLIGYSLLNPLRHHIRADAFVTLVLIALQLSLWVWCAFRAMTDSDSGVMADSIPAA
jgi:hypothetical protein